MRRTVWKPFWLWDFDKEEAWLNEMASAGLHITGVSYPFRFVFEEGMPGAYAVKLEMLDRWPSHPESVRYIRFVEETGAEYIGSIVRFVYFRKKTDAGGFDLFSDLDSRIRHLNRILLMAGFLCLLQVMNTVNFFLRFFVRWPDLAREDMAVPMVMLFPLVAMAALILYGFVIVALKKRELKKDRALHE